MIYCPCTFLNVGSSFLLHVNMSMPLPQLLLPPAPYVTITHYSLYWTFYKVDEQVGRALCFFFFFSISNTTFMVVILSKAYTWGSWGSERWNDMPKEVHPGAWFQGRASVKTLGLPRLNSRMTHRISTGKAHYLGVVLKNNIPLLLLRDLVLS